MKKIAFIDIEVGQKGKILDIGAVKWDNSTFHSSKIKDFNDFISDCDYLCGHNIVEHDLKYLSPFLKRSYVAIDTLYFSPILFPELPYHRLVKDDKIISDEINNPLNDSIKAKKLYFDEVFEFSALSENEKRIYFDLLGKDSHFKGFFDSLDYSPNYFSLLFRSSADKVRESLQGRVCKNADFGKIIERHPVGLAYAISVIKTSNRYSVTPPWVLKTYPEVENIIHVLRGIPCHDRTCGYCEEKFNVNKALKKWFGYDSFRTYDGEPLQEKAVQAAVDGKSLLAVFPTGGGKSLTFQLPALMDYEASKALTVVISPLQSLMKDQVENLEKKGIADAVFINGLLSQIERAEAIERVMNGKAGILYIAPESLRSVTIEKILMSRTISRFVIDEAHCFSAWGQDFRIEYQYIGEFIRKIQKQKDLSMQIPVSCFTATAKPKVISDIIDYFNDENNLILNKFASAATRTNLHYQVLYRASEDEKYLMLRSLLQDRTCPAIVYVSRTKLAEKLSSKLVQDGFSAAAFHGQMEVMTKIRNQEDFINNKIQIIVATSAFGMGVDKSDVGLVVHFDISDSLENYLQEAGRAGRDVNSSADCYVLYNDDDLNKHFILLNQTKLTLSEINQVWMAIKSMTQQRPRLYISALEIARKAGWEEKTDVETKVKSAISALEVAGYIKRGMNSPRIYATSIIPDTYDAAAKAIDEWNDFTDEERINSRRIIKSLISEKQRAKAGTIEAESRIDYLSDILGIETGKVIKSVERMRAAGILAKDNDMTAYLRKRNTNRLQHYLKLESFLLSELDNTAKLLDLKELNEKAVDNGNTRSNIRDIRTIIMFWRSHDYFQKTSSKGIDRLEIVQAATSEELNERHGKRAQICYFLIDSLYKMENLTPEKDYHSVTFSAANLLEQYNKSQQSDILGVEVTLEDFQEALLFLAKMGILTLEGGFMVLYNKLEIERLADAKFRYKKEDYQKLNEFYRLKIQQIHIVGEFANMLVRDYDKALEYVRDYFHLEYKAFIKKYFDVSRQIEISQNISPDKYKEIFGCLTKTQEKIITDKESKYIVVAAGPGSGKTFVLVRKLASLILMEDIKSEKLLMLTFSRAAATEFSRRLSELIGNAAKYVEIRTFHSYAFDILGQRGTLEKNDEIVKKAVEEIRANRVERSRITKSILVIDEAQDMSADEFALVEELISHNEDLRIIAVGDDDQNIYSFRGSDSEYFNSFVTKYQASKYDMLENFRSCRTIVDAANCFAETIPFRMKTASSVAVRSEKGCTCMVRHSSCNFEQAIVNDIISRHLQGKTAVLTFTNEDALVIMAMLKRQNINAKLVQSNENFNLYDLKEFRCMTEYFKKDIVVNKDRWNEAIGQIKKQNAGSRCLYLLENCIQILESLYPGDKYVSDIIAFICESKLEDFASDSRDAECVTISTIHKSKGKEFDNVFISLKGLADLNAANKRAVYVAMTRAKVNMSIHCPESLKLEIHNPDMSVAKDDRKYGEPSELLFQLTHRDVMLNFFKNKAEFILSLNSGDKLQIKGDYLYCRNRCVAKFSQNFIRAMAQLSEKGYCPHDAAVRFIVYWHYDGVSGDPSTKTETPIVLPDILFRKTSESHATGGCSTVCI